MGCTGDCDGRRDPLPAHTVPKPGWKTLSDALLYSSAAGPLVPLLTTRGNGRLTDALVMGEVLLLTVGVTEAVKATVSEPRPYAFADLRDWPAKDASSLVHELGSADAWSSYPSGHTSLVAASSFGLATLWSLHHRDTKPGLHMVPFATATLLTSLQGTARVMALRHDPVDTVMGGLTGMLAGTLVPLAHLSIARAVDPERARRRRARRGTVSVAPVATPTSVGLEGRW